MVSLEESKAKEWSVIIFNHVWSLLSWYNVFSLFKIHDLHLKISLFEKILWRSLFDRISCYGVLGSLKHIRPPCKGSISVFIRSLISPSQHTVQGFFRSHNTYLNIPLLIVGGKAMMTSGKWSIICPTAGGNGYHGNVWRYRSLNSRQATFIFFSQIGKLLDKAMWKCQRYSSISRGTPVVFDRKTKSRNDLLTIFPSEELR